MTAIAIHRVSYNGLRKRETYDEIIDHLLNKQEVIRYPDRFAKRVRESPYLTQLDGAGMDEMDDQQLQAMRHQELLHAIQQQAMRGPKARHELEAEESQTSSVPARAATTQDLDGGVSGFQSAVDDDLEQEEHNRRRQRSLNILRFQESLKSLAPDSETVLGTARRLASGGQTVASALASGSRSAAGAAAPYAQSAAVSALDLAAGVGKHMATNFVENVKATPAAIANVGSAVGGAMHVTKAVLDASRKPPAGGRDPSTFTVMRQYTSSESEVERELLTGRPLRRIQQKSSDPRFERAPQPSVSSARPLPPSRDPRAGGTEIDYSTNRSHWRQMNKAYIIDQLRLRGKSLPSDATRLKAIKKDELLEILFNTF